MVSSNNISVRRRNSLVIGATLASISTCARIHNTLLLRGLLRAASVLGAVVHVVVVAAMTRVGLLLRLVLVALGALDVDVCDAAAFVMLGHRFVLVGRLRILGDNIPGMQETGNETENREEDID